MLLELIYVHTQKGGDPKILFDAFTETANYYKGSKENFKLYHECALELARTGKYFFTDEELNDLFEELSKKDFPAIHHSKEYQQEYKTAYRVVDLKYLTILKNE